MNEDPQAVLPASDWAGMSVSQMWDLIKDHNAESAAQQAMGWSMTSDLLDHHLRRLEECRDRLTQRWQGDAAKAFLARVDGLLDSLHDMRRTALANDPVLPHLSASLVEAKAKLEPIRQQWDANQAQLTAAQQASPVARTIGDWVGSHDSTRAQQTELHAQAVTVMTTLARNTTEGYNALTMPLDYEPDGHSYASGDTWTPDPGPPAADNGGSAGSGGGGTSSVMAASGLAPRPGASPGSPGSPGAAPVLSGGPSDPSPSAAPPSWSSPGVGGPGVPQRPLPGQVPVGPVVGPVLPEIGGGGRSSGGGGWSRSQWVSSGGRGLPPGGVINGPPEGTVEPLARPASGGGRVNPVGGVIGPTTGRETEGMFAPPVGGGVGGRSGQRQLRTNSAYHTDEHWPQPKGLPPVIGATEPEPEPVHDPGPVLDLTPPELRETQERREARESDWSRQYRERRDR